MRGGALYRTAGVFYFQNRSCNRNKASSNRKPAESLLCVGNVGISSRQSPRLLQLIASGSAGCCMRALIFLLALPDYWHWLISPCHGKIDGCDAQPRSLQISGAILLHVSSAVMPKSRKTPHDCVWVRVCSPSVLSLDLRICRRGAQKHLPTARRVLTNAFANM